MPEETKKKAPSVGELRKKFREYAKSLDNEEQDEWYASKRESWEGVFPGFLEWYKRNK